MLSQPHSDPRGQELQRNGNDSPLSPSVPFALSRRDPVCKARPRVPTTARHCTLFPVLFFGHDAIGKAGPRQRHGGAGMSHMPSGLDACSTSVAPEPALSPLMQHAAGRRSPAARVRPSAFRYVARSRVTLSTRKPRLHRCEEGSLVRLISCSAKRSRHLVLDGSSLNWACPPAERGSVPSRSGSRMQMKGTNEHSRRTTCVQDRGTGWQGRLSGGPHRGPGSCAG